MKIERTIEIDAAPKAVYDVVMDPARLADWVTIHVALEGSPPERLRGGSTLTQVLRLAGRRFHVRWKVVENDPCKRVVWEGRGPVASHARVEYDFAENGGGTRFSYMNEYDLPGGVLGRVASRAVSRVADKEMNGSLGRLKRMLE